MGSNHAGEVGEGSGRPSSCNSRRGKKSSSAKQKQPQRGLGVAQLEKIRIQSQFLALYNNTTHPDRHLTMEEDLRLPLSLTFPSSPSSSLLSSVFRFHSNLMETKGASELSFMGTKSTPLRLSSYHELPATLPLMEDSGSYSAGYFNHVSDSIKSQDLDLELRLSR